MKAYTLQELRDKIASNDYGAELCLQHAMLCIDQLSQDAERYRWLRDGVHMWLIQPSATMNLPHDEKAWPVGALDAKIDAAMAGALLKDRDDAVRMNPDDLTSRNIQWRR